MRTKLDKVTWFYLFFTILLPLVIFGGFFYQLYLFLNGQFQFLD